MAQRNTTVQKVYASLCIKKDLKAPKNKNSWKASRAYEEDKVICNQIFISSGLKNSELMNWGELNTQFIAVSCSNLISKILSL